MHIIAGAKCLTGAEVIKVVGEPLTTKRLEHLRALGLIPRPIKIGTGNGTIGYYPDDIVIHLHEVDKYHRQGESYPKIVQKLRDKTIAIEIKTQKIKNDHQARIAVAKQINKYRNLPINEIRFTFSLENHNSEVRALQDELKKLFERKDNLSSEVLLKIKDNIEKIQKLESLKNAVMQEHKESRKHIKK